MQGAAAMAVRGELHLAINGELTSYQIDSPRFTFGRGNENSLCIHSSVVSRTHAELIRVGNDFLFRDLGSTNGSFINNARISEQVLIDGDLIRFGNNGPELTFHRIEQATGAIVDTAPPSGAQTENLMDSLAVRLDDHREDDVCDEVNMRCLLAESHLNKGEVERALEVLEKYKDPGFRADLPENFQATALLWLGRSYLENKQLDRALECLQESLALYKQASDGKGDDTGIASAHASIGRTMINLGDYLAAHGHLQRAKLAARRAGNTRQRAEIHYLIGKIDWKEGDFEGARYNWQRALRMAEETNDPPLLGRLMMQQALVLYTEGKLKEAVPAYQEAIRKIEATGNYRLLLKGYSSLSRALTRLGSWTTTARLVDERLQMARLHGVSKAEALALTDQAELKLLQGDLQGANESIDGALAAHGETIYARTQRILGRILQARALPTEAKVALETGLEAARKRGSIEEQVLISLELAQLVAEQGEIEKARELVESAEVTTALDPALNLTARALFTRGCINRRDNRINEANRCFSQSLSIFQTIGDPLRTALCHTEIGGLRLAQQRFASARAHLEEARGIFARLGAIAELKKVEGLLAIPMLSEVVAAMTTSLPGLGGTSQLMMANKTLTGALQVLNGQQAIQRILVAVANDELANLLVRGLAVENYQVELVKNGREASSLALQESKTLHLLLLDALLEHQSGFDVCRELRKKKIETPVILLGGRQGLEDKIEALQSGADDFISKRNLILEELLAKIDALLR